MILSLYSRGMRTRDIEAHLREVYGVNASRELISNITDVVVDEIKAWQSRPLDEVYPNLCGRYPDSGQGQRGGHHQDGLPGHWCRRGRPRRSSGRKSWRTCGIVVSRMS